MTETPENWPYRLENLEEVPEYIKCIDMTIEFADLRAGQDVLELGVGPGTAAKRILAKEGLRVTSIDINHKYLKAFKENVTKNGVIEANSEFELLVADARKLPFSECSFDRIVAAFTLGRIPDSDENKSDPALQMPKLGVLKDCFRLLKPGGKLALSEVCIDFYGKKDDEYVKRVHETWREMIAMINQCAQDSEKYGEIFRSNVQFEKNTEIATVENRDGKFFIGLAKWTDLLQKAGFCEIRLVTTNEKIGYTAIIATKLPPPSGEHFVPLDWRQPPPEQD